MANHFKRYNLHGMNFISGMHIYTDKKDKKKWDKYFHNYKVGCSYNSKDVIHRDVDSFNGAK